MDRVNYLDSEHSAFNMVCRAFCVLFCSVLYFSQSVISNDPIVVGLLDVCISASVVVVVTTGVVGPFLKERKKSSKRSMK